jgi:hypothetical protein
MLISFNGIFFVAMLGANFWNPYIQISSTMQFRLESKHEGHDPCRFRQFIHSDTQAASWEDKSTDFFERTDSANNITMAQIQIPAHKCTLISNAQIHTDRRALKRTHKQTHANSNLFVEPATPDVTNTLWKLDRGMQNCHEGF